MSAPMMPQHSTVQTSRWGNVIEVVLPADTPVVVVPIDRASWDAMVERTAPRLFLGWGSQSEDTKEMWRVGVEDALRAALNLPDGWTP